MKKLEIGQKAKCIWAGNLLTADIDKMNLTVGNLYEIKSNTPGLLYWKNGERINTTFFGWDNVTVIGDNGSEQTALECQFEI
jgi:hypothetical protein